MLQKVGFVYLLLMGIANMSDSGRCTPVPRLTSHEFGWWMKIQRGIPLFASQVLDPAKFTLTKKTWQPLGPLLKVKLLVGYM